MRRYLFDRVNLPAGQGHVLDGLAADPDAECARFEERIAAAGGIDLMILGLGANGHIGFNEPDTSLQARDASRAAARAVAPGQRRLLRRRPVAGAGRGDDDGDGDDSEVAPHPAAGDRCARRPRRSRPLLNGPVTTQLPASFLQLHGHVELICDAEPPAAILGRAGLSQPAGTALGRGGGLATRYLAGYFLSRPSSARRRGSASSPTASRTESCDLRSVASALDNGRPVRCMTIAALTSLRADLSSLPAVS